jgi:hypothetical protein
MVPSKWRTGKGKRGKGENAVLLSPFTVNRVFVVHPKWLVRGKGRKNND